MDRIMDPKIMAIMAKLNPDLTQEEEKVDEKLQKPVIKLPKTLEDYLELECLDDWPAPSELQEPLDLRDELEDFASVERLLTELREATPQNVKIMDELQSRFDTFEATLYNCGSIMLNNFGTFSQERKALSTVAKTDSATDMDVKSPEYQKEIEDSVKPLAIENGPETIEQEHDVKQTSQPVRQKPRKSIQHCRFPGFSIRELTPLPNKMEAPLILNRVTKTQDFVPGFRRFWKKIFLSEASVAVFQDSFWWFFIEHFADRRHEEEKNRLFDRIADSFTALFQSVNSEIKDRVFSVYPDCLAQAVFAAFRLGFAESLSLFRDSFKESLVSTTTEWVTGLRPLKGSWKKWNTKKLAPVVSVKAAPGQMSIMDDDEHPVTHSLDMAGFNQVVSQLGTSSFDSPHFSHSARLRNAGVIKPSSPVIPITPPKREPRYSHPVAPGPHMERIMFSLGGRSPLIAHCLHMRNLRSNHHYGQKLRRTEVTEEPAGGQTYNDVIEERQTNRDKMNKSYNAVCEETKDLIAKIERHRVATNRRIDKLQKQLMWCHDNEAMKSISEKIRDNIESMPRSGQIPTKPIINNNNDDDDDDDDDDDEDDE